MDLNKVDTYGQGTPELDKLNELDLDTYGTLLFEDKWSSVKEADSSLYWLTYNFVEQYNKAVFLSKELYEEIIYYDK